MPYDPRPVSKGGNRGAGETFQLKSDKGKFRVVGVDTFDGGDWVVGDYDTKEEALAIARAKGGQMTMMYVYDSAGNRIGSAGTF